MNTQCTPSKIKFQIPNNVRPGHIEADFSGGEITSDGGVVLASAIAERMNLFRRIAECFDDRRHPSHIVHQLDTLIGQRILALVQGYEDLNDHDALRRDSLIGAVLGCVESKRADCEPLAGKSTLNRLELSAAGFDGSKHRKVRADFDKLDALLVELFVESHGAPPSSITLDIDATDFELHGGQQDRFYHGYYREYCYMPLLILCEDFPVMVRLRSAAGDAAAGVEDLLAQVVGQIRQHWPNTHIIVRTDSGFCRDEILSWCEREQNVDYVIGLARNSRLNKGSFAARRVAGLEAGVTGEAARRFCEFGYRTLKSWSRRRRVICKAEALPESYIESAKRFKCKDNARYIVTSLDADTHPGRELYEGFYCQRGDAENRLREVKADLFAQRCSSNLFNANALRLVLSACAQVLFIHLRRSLQGSELARCQPATIRLKLLKIGGQVKRSARRIHVALSGAFAHQATFFHAWQNIAPG